MKKKRSPAATKADLKDLATKQEFRTELQKLGTKKELRSEMRKLKDEIIEGIKVLHENLLKDFRDIYSDKTSLLNDKVEKHEERITFIEEAMGIPSAS